MEENTDKKKESFFKRFVQEYKKERESWNKEFSDDTYIDWRLRNEGAGITGAAVALYRVISDDIYDKQAEKAEKKRKEKELAEKLSGSIKTSDIIIESKTAEAAKDEHETSLEENDLDER